MKHYSYIIHKVVYEYTLCNPNPGVVLNVVTKNQIGILGRLNSDISPLNNTDTS